MKEKILELRMLGYSYGQIKQELGCAKSTISYHCKNMGINIPNEHPNKLDKNLIRLIRKESNSISLKEISKKHGVSIGVVQKYVGNHVKRIRTKSIIKKICPHCEKEFETKNKNKKYCSVKCGINYNRQIRINKWLSGEDDGRMGKTGTARWIKTYLIEKHGEKCMECGWNERNVYTGNIPIELEHIDGDFTNNKEENLKLLCPSCHSLTPTYRGGNKKKGRPRAKYYRGS